MLAACAALIAVIGLGMMRDLTRDRKQDRTQDATVLTSGRKASPFPRSAIPTFIAAAGSLAPGSGSRSSAEMQAAADRAISHALRAVPAAVYSLFPAISWTESRDRDDAVGDGGRSRGRYQIGLAYWIDGGGDPERNETDVLNPALCRRVMIGYWQCYCPAALATGDSETLARVHNGGPRGTRNAATKKYWKRVRKAVIDMN
jgi:hypothetical protein